uniref:Uncharacterized protein n=1 Tax=Chromera velia CCMP2878 TaxID=1169474 RepID=A0A0G4I9V1_9ALVE|eukprot:Cvel_12389.t1-p1 / transcript=Cvel_12389.t1 / gene=Cvel_12389 / organism=Chromera_velia_CCMP2878 / gene_product=hypothetical protein / transcript_product=hypothetical protein / location=Cvel_scaffold809:49239-49439(+) / protein_length=67 / sequence_SO=supercontig / SO=protein_coding / is_pseudo=false
MQAGGAVNGSSSSSSSSISSVPLSSSPPPLDLWGEFRGPPRAEMEGEHPNTVVRSDSADAAEHAKTG